MHRVRRVVKLPGKILIGLAAVFVAGQFIRPTRNEGERLGPNHISGVVPVPGEVETILQRACYDCHSNRTNYPWYANVQPVAWWLADHVSHGKKDLNFSEFATYPPKRAAHKLEEVADEVRKHQMPLRSYTRGHPEARLTDAERRTLIDWAERGQRLIEERVER